MRPRKPTLAKLLIALCVVLGIGGVMGAYGFLSDPSGTGMGLSTDLLAGLPVSDFLLVGLFLGVVYGAGSFVVAAGLWALSGDRWLGFLSLRTSRHWSWTMTVLLGAILLAWTVLEYILFIGTPKLAGLASGPNGWVGYAIWGIFVGLALAILAVASVPSVRRYAVRAAAPAL